MMTIFRSKVKQLDIFGNEVEIETADPPRPKGRPPMATMNEMWGTMQGRKCGNCKHFLRLRYHDKTYFKCDLWVVSHSTATDKRVSNDACNRWEWEMEVQE